MGNQFNFSCEILENYLNLDALKLYEYEIKWENGYQMGHTIKLRIPKNLYSSFPARMILGLH